MIEIEGNQERDLYKETFDLMILAAEKGALTYFLRDGGGLRMIMYTALGIVTSKHSYEDFLQALEAAY